MKIPLLLSALIASIPALTPLYGARQAIPLFCDTATYAPLELTWSPSSGIRLVTQVYPHPVNSLRALLTTTTGLYATTDGGRTWTPLPQASADKVGAIRRVVFDPTDAATFYIASGTKGVWVTSDGGASFRQAGSAASGMAADEVADLILYPGDATGQTLLAVHGQAGGGISRSRNGGQSWDVVNTGYYFTRIRAREKNSTEVFLFGSAVSALDLVNLYSCRNPSELAVEIMHDKLLTDMALLPSRTPSPLFVATSDGGLSKVSLGEQDAQEAGAEDASWSSVSASWGPNADVLRLWLYDPSKQGLVFTDNGMETSARMPGALVSPLVKEGAAVRPNSNGTIFYAVANGALSIGRSTEVFPAVDFSPSSVQPSPEDVSTFTELAAALRNFSKIPAGSRAGQAAAELLQSAGDPAAPYRRCELVLTAKVPLDPAPTAVTADLSRLGGSEATPLYDDGLHHDGTAGDGLYGIGFCFCPLGISARQDDWRPTWPGRIAAGVAAVYPDGRRCGAVGVLGVYSRIRSFDLWPKAVTQVAVAGGGVTLETVRNPAGVHGGSPALKILVKKGPWSVSVKFPYGKGDITSYQGLAFWVKAVEGTAPKELYVQLRDKPTYTESVVTERVPVVAEGTPQGSLGADYVCVTAPFARLLGENSPLEKSKATDIIISGDAGEPVTLMIDGLRILASTDEVHPFNEAQSK